ncbi:MAG TPA: dihydrodipicolinate synthase family protein [Ktedonobacterales bacterium]
MTPFELAGIYPALPTFFDPSERLDLDLIAEHVSLLSDLGITQFVALGSNGEAISLTAVERQEVVATLRERVPAAKIIAGAGGQSEKLTLAYIQDVMNAGAEAALVLTPSYYVNSSTTKDDGQIQANLRRFYLGVADKSPLPIIIYNMPNVAAKVDISAETVLALSGHENIIGLKDSSGNIEKVRAITTALAARPHTPENTFSVIVGSGSKVYDGMRAGARGGILALANVAPRECLRLYSFMEAGQHISAEKLQSELAPVNDLITSVYGVAGLKAAVRILHINDHPGDRYAPRRPLLPLTEPEGLNKIEQALRAARLRDALDFRRGSSPR